MSSMDPSPGKRRGSFASAMRLCGALARPELPNAARVAEALAKAPTLESILGRASVPLVAPLFLHHLIQLGMLPAQDLPGARQMLQDAASVWARRRHLLDALLVAAAKRGLEPPVLVQGTGMAPLYPSPALRTTADLDVLVPASGRRAWEALLRANGWTPTSGNWVHHQGTNLDLHSPASSLGEALVAEATEAPEVRGARLPPNHLHLALVARHLARHQADRLWRDVADVQLLLGRSDPGVVLEESWRAAPADAREPLAGIVRFVDRWCDPLPWRPPAGIGERCLALCERQALAKAGAAELDLLEPLLLGRASAGGSPKAGGGIARRVDSQLGVVPRPGWRLQALRVRLLVASLLGGDLASKRRLMRARRELRLHGSDFQ